MKAAILHELGTPLTIEAVPDPVAGPGEVVVEIAAAPVFSYTNEVFDGTRTHHLTLPMTPGCGAIGRVRETGPDATRLAPGAWVFCDPTVRARDDAIAPDIMLQGWIAPTDGARRLQQWMRAGSFAEQMRVPMECVFPLGDIAPSDASRWCAAMVMLVPYGGWLASGLQPGETALVNAATGNFGSAAVAVALAMGAGTVLATGRNEPALADLVRRFGTRVRPVRLSGDAAADTACMQAVAAGPIDRVLDILPPLPDAAPVRAAAMSVRPNGSVVLMGGLGVDVALPYRWLMRNNITIRGQWMYPRDAIPRFIALLRSGLLSLDHVDVAEFPLAGINQAIAHAAANAGAFRLTVLRP
ncbi:MAG TPA: zinc-binding alcohol dehydrogenase family protein [Acetobacteraceae bacterium]|nr:zinc-binding alcohol dehydrogenase family protein [Acetobacteraceae bacterium]